MTTSFNINEALLKEALALDNQVNIDSLVETALREYIQRRKRLKVLDLFGTIEYDEGYNYNPHSAPQTVTEGNSVEKNQREHQNKHIK